MLRGLSSDPRLDAGDARWLERTIELGRGGWGRVHPNPMVGAAIVRDARLLAEGFHEEYGGPHAEVVALHRVDAPRGATLYSSLEPCRHVGKTPACTRAIRDAGIARVVYWARDPGAESGGGAEWLEAQGVRVDGPFGDEADWAAENPFFFRPGTGRPYVAVKLATSLDGRIAPRGGQRVWLTGEGARAEVHRLRAGFDAILVGTNTWKADDPALTARGTVVPRVPPRPVLLDPRGELSTSARVLRDRPGGSVLLATREDRAVAVRERLGDGAEVIPLPEHEGGLDLAALLTQLRNRGIERVLCEGGGALSASLLRDGLVDRLYLFVAPSLIGETGVPAFPGRAEGLLQGWQSRLEPVRFEDDTLIVLDRGD